MILNTQGHSADIIFNLTESWAIRAGRAYNVYDMWSHTHNGTVLRNITINLPTHGVAALLFNDERPEPPPEELDLPYCAGWSQCSWSNGTYYSNNHKDI
jgi:alpha-galactosidase